MTDQQDIEEQTRYEIHCYESGTDEEGGIYVLDSGHFDTVPLVETGFCVYVRDYVADTPGDLDVIYEQDFKTQEEAHAAVAKQLTLYPDANLEFY